MFKSQSPLKLPEIAESAYVPAVAYAGVEPKKENKQEFVSTSLTFGKKNAQASNTGMNEVDKNTRFPASSLSKIVFTYLVLQLVKERKISLDEALHNILPYERFKVDGEYPEKARKLTARHVLSHTTSLPNFGSGSDSSSTLLFNSNAELGKIYFYSGEAFFYLQKVIEEKMQKDFESLAQDYVFKPLGMERSTFLPQPKNDPNIVKIHTELGKSTSINADTLHLNVANAAGSLLTTADDFLKFITAWLENMNAPIFKQAFEPTSDHAFPTCGLGWHLYKNEGEIIAYQYGENLNTRSFIAINVTTGKGAAFFTNSEHGMSIANQLLNSSNFVPIGDLREVFKTLSYTQSDEPGWQATMAGKIAEDQGNFEKAKKYFEEACSLALQNQSKKLRLEWFNAVHQSTQKKTAITPLDRFTGTYNNPYKDEVNIHIEYNYLIYEQFGQKTKLVRMSETDFAPEKDQSFKISFNDNQMTIHFIHAPPKFLAKQPLAKSQGQTSVVPEKQNKPISQMLCQSGMFACPEESTEYLIQHRHDNPKAQRKYDQRFGLVLKNNQTAFMIHSIKK